MSDVYAELERSPAAGEITPLARIIRQSGSASPTVGTKMPIHICPFTEAFQIVAELIRVRNQSLETEATPELQR